MTGPEQKGAPPCGLYLIMPQGWMEPDFLKNLRDLFRSINASRYEKNSHVIEFRAEDRKYGAEEMDIIRALAELTKSQGIIFIVGNNIALAKTCAADGVMLEDAAQIEEARREMGEDAIVGVRCGQSRRLAEKALEHGIDCVSFYEPLGGLIDPGIIEWWHYKTGEACLIEGRITNDDCAFYVAAGADFIDASHYVWNHPKGVMQGVVNMMHAIDIALDAQNENSRKAL